MSKEKLYRGLLSVDNMHEYMCETTVQIISDIKAAIENNTTFRDQLAMSCPVTISEFDSLRDQKVNPFENDQTGLFAAYCKFRYDYADGMMAARTKQPE